MFKDSTTCEEAVRILENEKSNQLIVSNDNVHVKGVVVLNVLMSNLISGAVKLTDFVEKAMIKHYVKVKSSATLGQLSRVLEKESYAVILDDEHDNTFVGVIDQSYILKFITKSNGTIKSNN